MEIRDGFLIPLGQEPSCDSTLLDWVPEGRYVKVKGVTIGMVPGEAILVLTARNPRSPRNPRNPSEITPVG